MRFPGDYSVRGQGRGVGGRTQGVGACRTDGTVWSPKLSDEGCGGSGEGRVSDRAGEETGRSLGRRRRVCG